MFARCWAGLQQPVGCSHYISTWTNHPYDGVQHKPSQHVCESFQAFSSTADIFGKTEAKLSHTLQYGANCMLAPSCRRKSAADVLKYRQYIIVPVTLGKRDSCAFSTSTSSVTMAAHNADMLTLEEEEKTHIYCSIFVSHSFSPCSVWYLLPLFLIVK